MFDGRWRTSVDRVTEPAATMLRRTGVTADHLTGLGLVLGVATAVAVGTGRLGLGLVLLVASALPDLFDGPLAKATGTAGPRGAFFDSVADRVTDALVLGGIGWYLASEHGGHAALLPFAVLAASGLISYERAKAESLGYAAKGGLMERAERIIALSFGLLFSALLVPVLWLTLALTVATAAQRFVKVWRQAAVVAPTRRRVVRTAPEGRWRAWRDSAVRSGRSRRQPWRARAVRG
ncbi:MAG: CDP-alcohol phosphatidyltransferase family protein, partial [Actinomycetota bacterium]|nr:CDP-alcohol phosphatidyltransferase family protein [Actinomycetota bacterium]